jgi:hypothetical protein
MCEEEKHSIEYAISTDIWTHILNILHLNQHTMDLFSSKKAKLHAMKALGGGEI